MASIVTLIKSLSEKKSWEIFLHASLGEWDLKVTRQAKLTLSNMLSESFKSQESSYQTQLT